MTTARDVIAQRLATLEGSERPWHWHVQKAEAILEALAVAPDSVRQELVALLSPWRPIDEATDEDKDGYVLGFVAGTKLPMVALWDDDENRWFALNRALKAEWNPTHFMRLPGPLSEDKT